jgi:SsrA-binding protein
MKSKVERRANQAAKATLARDEKKVLLRNKKVRHDFFVEETFEAGLVLVGSEVKSLREAKGILGDAYVAVKNGEAWVYNMQISEYPWANIFNHAPKRDRKLLLHRREIEKLAAATERDGYTCLPLELYLKNGKLKLEVGVCKGKKQYDKREDSKRRDAQREMEAAMKIRR